MLERVFIEVESQWVLVVAKVIYFCNGQILLIGWFEWSAIFLDWWENFFPIATKCDKT